MSAREVEIRFGAMGVCAFMFWLTHICGWFERLGGWTWMLGSAVIGELISFVAALVQSCRVSGSEETT